jgi:hypothetical protein
VSSTFDIYILSFAQNLPIEVLGSLVDHNVRIIDPEEYLPNQTIHLLFFDTDIDDIEDTIKKYKLKEKNLPIISFEAISDYKRFLKLGGVGVFNPQLLHIPEMHNALIHYVRKANSLRIVDSFSGNLKSINTFKLVNHLYSGFYIDIMSEDVIQHGFDIASIRTHFNSLVTYVTYLSNQNIVGFPAEVHYGQSENIFVIQFTISAFGFVSEYLDSAFDDKYSLTKPFANTLSLANATCNFFNIQYLKVSGKIVFNSVWLKDADKSSALEFPSTLISDISYYEKLKNLSAKPVRSPKVLEIKLKDNISTELAKRPLKGESLYNIRDDSSYLINKPLLLREIIAFLELRHSLQDLYNSTLSQVKEWLEDFSHHKIKSFFKEKDYVLVHEALRDLNFREKIASEADQTLDALDQNDKLKEEYVDDVYKLFQNHQLIDHAETVSGGEEEASSLIKILGDRLDLTPEAWKVKRLSLNEKVEKLFERVKEGKYDVRNLKDEVARVISMELSVSKDAVKPVVNELFEGAAHKVTSDRFPAKVMNGWEVASVKADEEVLAKIEKDEIQKRDRQILRMKELIDKMRSEMNQISRQSSTNSSHDEVNGQIYSANLERAEKMIDLKEKEVERAKSNHESILAAKNHEINHLKEQLENLKNKVAIHQAKSLGLNRISLSPDKKDEPQVKIEHLTNEIDQLRKMNKTMNIEFMKIQEQNIVLTKKLKKSQAIIAESDHPQVEEPLQKVPTEKAVLSKIFEKASLEIAQSNVNDPIDREQENKDLKLKNKLLEEQVSRMLEKNSTPHQNTTAQDVQHKRLETLHQKLEEQSKKQEIELAQKKKELVGIKQENQLLKHKIEKLERKIAISKKAG